ncbi:Zn(2)-C6 transcription factor [Pseudohyphozyma bogoriensis]|nr:Zn(2)-C6 transcription factor [Pseudohyphozyma bogoriensis]
MASTVAGESAEQEEKKREFKAGRAYASPDSPCARCKAANLSCTFEQKAVKRGPPKGYVESLERRLEAMEKVLAALNAKPPPGFSEQFTAMANEWDEDEPPEPATATSPETSGVMDALTAEMEELSVDKDRYVGRGSGLHLARSLQEYSKTDHPALEDDMCPSLVEQLLHQEHELKSHTFPLPPKDLYLKLIDAFFDVFNSHMALLHRPSFERRLADGSLQSSTPFRSLFFMVCALGAREVEDERLNIMYAEGDYEGSRHSRGFEFFRAGSASASPALMSAKLFDIQASVLGIVWLLGSSTPISGWAAVGFARLLSSGLGRPLAIAESDVDLTEPLDIGDADLDAWNEAGPTTQPILSTVPGPMAAVGCMRRLQYIMGRILRSLYGMNRQPNPPQKASEAVQELDSMLNKWLEEIPEHLKWDPERQDPKWIAMSTAIYSNYYCCQILIHRNFISPSTSQMHMFPSLAICSNAARSCSHVLDHARKTGNLKVGFFFFPMAAVTSGLILLINVFSRSSLGPTTLTSSAMGDVKKCIEVLRALAPSTFLAARCASGLEHLVKVAIDRANAAKGAAGLKRSVYDSEDSSSPLSSATPASSHHSPEASGLEHSESGYKNSRRRLDLPFTTDDLSLLTFNGHQTFSRQPVSAAAAAAPPPAPVVPSVPNPLSNTQLPADPSANLFDLYPSLQTTGQMPYSSAPALPSTSQPNPAWNPAASTAPDFNFGLGSMDFSGSSGAVPFATAFDPTFAGMGGQPAPQMATNTSLDNFNWADLNLAQEPIDAFDAFLPMFTGQTSGF